MSDKNPPVNPNQRLAEIGAWVVQTCLLMGASPTTAYEVAAAFVEGVERELNDPQQPQSDMGTERVLPSL
jgi:hypothetical protein